MEDDTIFEANTSMEILNHIREKYDFDPVQPSHLINKFGYSMSLQRRDDLLCEAKKLYDTRWGNRSTANSCVHRVGIIGGCSGLGRSRALIEIANSIKTWKTASQWSFEIVISYGDDQTTDRRLFETRASTALALRLLYFSFVSGKSGKRFQISFESFVSSFPRVLLDVLTVEIAIQAIGSHISERNGSNDGVIFIGLDDINKLLDRNYTGEEQKNTFLKQTLLALKSVMLSPDRFVFAVVTTRAVLPINIVCHQLDLQYQLLPINLLRVEHCESIVEEMASISSSWAQWRTCRAFRTLLADFGSMPRKLVEFLVDVEYDLSRGTALVDIDYNSMYNRLGGTQVRFFGLLPELAERIVSDVLLGTPVDRDQFLDSTLSPLKYGVLESDGMLVLETSVDTHLTVKMHHSQFCYVVQQMDGKDPLTKTLRKICNSRYDNRCKLSWRNIEDFHTYVEASREMLLARRYPARPYCSLEDFYCLTKVRHDFNFVLRSHCDVVTSATRSPSGARNVLLDDSSCHREISGNPLIYSFSYIKKAPGAAVNSFAFRQMDSEIDKSVLFCGKRMMHVETAVSDATIGEEVKKVEESLLEGAPFILVGIATKVTADASIDLPSNCIIVTGESLEEFYSVFSARATLLSDESLCRINVNTDSWSEVKAIFNLGIVVTERENNGYYANWKDLNTRVPRTVGLNEKRFSF